MKKTKQNLNSLPVKQIIRVGSNTVTSVCFLGDNYIVSGESNEDLLKIWDLRKLRRYCNDNLFNIQRQGFVGKQKAVEQTVPLKKSARGKKNSKKMDI